MIGRKEKELHDLLLDCFAYLVKNKKIIYWGNDSYANGDMMLDHIYELIGQAETLAEKRAFLKTIARYANGLSCDYMKRLERKPKNITDRVGLYLRKTRDQKLKTLFVAFLQIAGTDETLNDYFTDDETASDECSVPVNYAFRIYWREDALFVEQGQYIDTMANEYGVEEFVTSHVLLRPNGRVNWNIRHQCDLPRLLEFYFKKYNDFMHTKLKSYERNRQRQSS
jgi:hypothetical protein